MYNLSSTNREVELFVFDIYVAILKIETVSSEFENVENMLHDFRSWDSVIREFEIIGEASKYLLNENLLDTDYRRVVDFRNSIMHGYFGIEQNIVWEIIHHKLGDLKIIILELISKIEADLKQELIESYIEDNKYLDFIVKELKRLDNE